MIIKKLNESFSVIIPENDFDLSTVQQMHDFLKAEKADAKYNFKVQRGWESPYRYLSTIIKEKTLPKQIALKVNNGHLELIKKFGIEQVIIDSIFGYSEFSEDLVNKELEYIKSLLPYQPYDYQEKCVKDCLLNPKQISLAATGAGKSLIIFMILYFLLRNNKKGYIIVPNINLLTQLVSDFEDYFKDKELAKEFLSNIDIQGGGNQSSFESFLTISTWQSLINKRDVLDKADFILCDELHRYSSDVTSEIIKETVNAKYKWGLTGTLPDDEGASLELIGMFGFPKRYIRARELIDRGLATPVKINSIILNYNNEDKGLFNSLPKGNWQKQLTFIKEHETRNLFITNLACKVKDTGNTLILGTHTEHIKLLFTDIMKKLYPFIEVQNKDITGKKSFEFQKKFGVYFLNGEDDAKTRELTRKIIDEKHYVLKYNNTWDVINENDILIVTDKNSNDIKISVNSLLESDLSNFKYKNYIIDSFKRRNEILVSNYQLLSTGVNIKALFNAILASPLKAYTTITQTIGRGLRLHPDKSMFNLYDIVDNFGIRKPSGIFFSQYKQRCEKSYNPEEFPIEEILYNLP